jgi:hypothetical protein
MKPTIIEAMDSPQLWAGWFKDKDTWQSWRSFLRAFFDLPMDDAGLDVYRQCTGRRFPRPGGHTEATLVVGRRGGKSLILALIASYLATFRDWRPHLTRGEKAQIVVIATDREQAQAIFGYLRELLAIPLLSDLIASEGRDVIELTNNVVLSVQTCSFRAIRGRTIVAALLDEVAFWRNDESSANPDSEVLAAIRPAQATIPGAIMLKASSPYARRGVLHDDYKRHYGEDTSAALVWQADTRTMNPSVPESFIAAETERDPANAASEYGAQFRSDIIAFVSEEALRACTVTAMLERLPEPATTYRGFVDPSGGSADSMTLAIAHYLPGKQVVVVDAIREIRPPFSPEGAVEDFCRLLKNYNVSKVTSDRYAGVWPVEQFAKFGVICEQSAKPKSDLYTDLLPLINSRRIELLDNPRTLGQLASLERRVSRGGKDSIDHPPRGHDDLANAVAGVASLCLSAGTFNWEVFSDNYQDDKKSPDDYRKDRLSAWDQARFWNHILINS